MNASPDRRAPAQARPAHSPAQLAFGVAAFILALLALVVVARPRRGSVPPPSVRPAAAGIGATVTGDGVEVWSEAWGRGTPVERLSRGARLTVAADLGRWLEVRTEKTRSGFVPSEFVETDSERASRERRTREILSFPPVFGVVAEETDVLLAPFPLAARSGRLRKGSAITIHAVDHAFYAFRISQGAIAFVNSADVDLVPPDPRKPAIAPAREAAIKDLRVANLPRAQIAPLEGSEAAPDQNAPAPVEEVAPPVLLSKVEPAYPEQARRAGVEGTVVLEASVSETGAVTDVQIMRGLPLGLSESAVEAVRRWRYRPARGRAGPIASRKTIRIVFTLGR